MNTNNELCKGCCNVGTDRNKWPCVDCCEAARFNEPKPDECSEELLPAVRRSKKPPENHCLYYRKINIPYLKTGKATYHKKEKWRRLKGVYDEDVFYDGRLSDEFEEFLAVNYRKKFHDGMYEFKLNGITAVVKLIKLKEVHYIIQSEKI